MDERVDDELIRLLRERDGLRTVVDTRRNVSLLVVNIGWGYDLSEPYAHVSTNVSPTVEGEDYDLFHTFEVTRVRDEASGSELYDGASDSAAAGYWLASLGLELIFAEDEHSKTWAALRFVDQSSILHPMYGGGESAAAATLSAAKRWQVEQIGRP